MTGGYDWPLMQGNLRRHDLDAAIALLAQDDPVLTQGRNVAAFEAEWCAWLGVPHSVFVNSGSSANLLTLAALREQRGTGEIVLPAVTWSSDVAAVLHCGFRPVFVDIDRRTLGADRQQVGDRLSAQTQGVFLTHLLGFNALDDALLATLRAREIPLLEDVCESPGATHGGRKLGTFGAVANFSFYYAHHLTTIEGGMISTGDPQLFPLLRMLRAHGLVRESGVAATAQEYERRFPDLNPEFTFAVAGFNVRGTELHAAIGRSQLRDLDARNERRRENLAAFLAQLDADRYFVEFAAEGNCSYALPLVLREPDVRLRAAVSALLHERRVEFRRGLSGGGNQLRQPYLRRLFGDDIYARFPVAEHVHFFGLYLGNYPDLPQDRIADLCAALNRL